MTFCCKIHYVVNVVLGKELVGKSTVADVTTHEEATLVVDIVLDGSEIAGIRQQVENNYLYILILILSVKEILDKICADESGSTCHEISFHII